MSRSRTLLLPLTLLTLAACDGRSLQPNADGAPPPSDRALPTSDGAAEPFCSSEAQCPVGMRCKGCFADPSCPMCDVCLHKCLPDDSCTGNDQCGAGELCVFAQTCGKVGPGQCALRPAGCDTLYAPACGCDNKTYSNACDAQSHGVSVAHEGVCDSHECDDLRQQYQQAMSAAKSCCAMCASVQCTIKVTSNLACGCTTFVQQDGELVALQKKWTDQGCDQQPYACPGAECADVQWGGCAADGTCESYLTD